MTQPTVTSDDLLGSLTWSDGKDVHATALVERACVSHRTIHLLSIVTTVPELKAIRACMQTKPALPVQAKDLPLTGESTGYSYEAERFHAAEEGYHVYAHRLGFSAAHALFVSRAPGFLLDGSDTALWNHLKSPAFTTPLLRPWLPHVRRVMEASSLLVRCRCYRADGWMSHATTEKLDDIVEHGIKRHHLRIEDEPRLVPGPTPIAHAAG